MPIATTQSVDFSAELGFTGANADPTVGHQMCGIRLEGFAGPYAEAAHVRPLGSPHNGPDTLNNIL